MKYSVLVSLLLLVVFNACTQTGVVNEDLYELRTDTFTILNPNGPGAELRVVNSTHHLQGGLLTNIDTNGLTQFRKLDLVTTPAGIGIVGQDSVALNYLPLAGGIIGTTDILSTNAHKIVIGMYSSGTGHSDAPKALDYTSVYLGLGWREYGGNSYRNIGFGYRSAVTDAYPGIVGYQEINTSGNTFGDLIFATRGTTSNVAPTIRMRITSAGAVKSYGTVTANEDVATKGYVDTSFVIVKAVTPTGTFSMNGIPSRTLVANNASGVTTFTMPLAKLGITYTFWKIGTSVMTISGAIADVGKNGTKVVSGTETNSSITFVCVGNSWLITAKNGTWTTQ